MRLSRSPLEKTRHHIEDYAFGFGISVQYFEDLLDSYTTEVRRALAEELMEYEAAGEVKTALEAVTVEMSGPPLW
jgi:hypothetical protein